MAEHRSIPTSKTGGRKGEKPEKMSLIPVKELLEVARLYDAGATKYSPHNWRKGYPWSSSYDAMMRHALAFWDGEDNIPEPEDPNEHDSTAGMAHLTAVVFHALTLLYNMKNHPEEDDRPHRVVE